MIDGFDGLHYGLLIVGLVLLIPCVGPLIDHWFAWRAEKRGEDGQR